MDFDSVDGGEEQATREGYDEMKKEMARIAKLAETCRASELPTYCHDVVNSSEEAGRKHGTVLGSLAACIDFALASVGGLDVGEEERVQLLRLKDQCRTLYEKILASGPLLEGEGDDTKDTDELMGLVKQFQRLYNGKLRAALHIPPELLRSISNYRLSAASVNDW